jgi:hypothetical protein
VVLRAAESLDPLAGLRGALVYEPGDGCRADEGDGVDPGMICCVSGTCSDGFSTNALPHPIANGRNQNGTIAGKLNGTIAAQTPTGWRIVSQSTFRDTSSITRPCIVVGIAQAHSTISIIRATSARASAIVLPISVVTERASSSRRASSPSRSANSRRARSITLTARHAGSASRAAVTAASSSVLLPSGTRASTSPLAGFVTSSVSAPWTGVQRPPT